MKKSTLYLIIGTIITLLITSSIILSRQLAKAKAEKEVYQKNTDILMGDIDTYKVKDSLNAVSVGNLELKLSEYKRYRSEDLNLINSLKVDKKRLEQITTAQTKTIYELEGKVTDSVIYRDNYIVDTLRCLDIHTKWYDLNGCTNKEGIFTGRLENRDSLIYVEHIVPKRFWFIKWGVKERKQEIISKNPSTSIESAEYITIRK